MTSLLRPQSRSSGKLAVVIGATSGIGKGCALRLAEAGFSVVAVGRDPSRGAEVVEAMEKISSNNDAATGGASAASGLGAKHAFYACNAFSLANVAETAAEIRKNHASVDALVLSQGMATIQGFTPTIDGNDQKLTLHYWSRMAFIHELLPSLRTAAAAAAAAEKAADPVVVVSVLSGGVHSPFAAYGTDAELKGSYSITNAANAAGFYNDLGLDAFAKKRENAGVTFVHASPGFVNTNWGTEMPWVIKSAVRVLQVFGRSPAACAEYMCSPMLRYSNAELAKMAERSAGLTTPRKTKAAAAEEEAGSEVDSSSSSGSAFRGVLVLGQDGDQKAVTKLHVPEAREAVWASTRGVLSRAGIVL